MPQAMHASLPMYDWPEISASWDALWALVRDELTATGLMTEERLRRPAAPAAQWRDPDLVVGQTCGWPYVSGLSGTVVPFARFDFGLPGAPGDYHSVFIGSDGRRPAELLADAQATIAVNSLDSQSGFRALSDPLDRNLEISGARLLLTGSHRESIRAVAEGRAQLAAIDAVSWRYALAHEPAAQQVVALGQSRPAPGLPLVTAARLAVHVPLLFDALSAAVAGLSGPDRDALSIAGVVAALPSDYDALLRPPFGRLSLA